MVFERIGTKAIIVARMCVCEVGKCAYKKSGMKLQS